MVETTVSQMKNRYSCIILIYSTSAERLLKFDEIVPTVLATNSFATFLFQTLSSKLFFVSRISYLLFIIILTPTSNYYNNTVCIYRVYYIPTSGFLYNGLLFVCAPLARSPRHVRQKQKTKSSQERVFAIMGFEDTKAEVYFVGERYFTYFRGFPFLEPAHWSK